MHALLQLTLSLGLAYGYAAAVRPLLRCRGRSGAAVSTVAAVSVLLSPLLIPPQHLQLRALAVFLCSELMFKMLDFARESRRQQREYSTADYLRFLIPFPSLVVVIRDRDRRLPSDRPRRGDVGRAVVYLTVFAASFGVADAIRGLDLLRNAFALDHAVRLLIFAVAIEAVARGTYALERLAGYDTEPPMRSILQSRTVADFWTRYNTRIQTWFERNVFRPSGGGRAPLRGIVLVFLVSAIHHELIFGIATSRIDGYQLAFFLLQAPAVIASHKLVRLARHRSPQWNFLLLGLTITWFYLTSMLFFHGLHRIFPIFYTAEPWLP